MNACDILAQQLQRAVAERNAARRRAYRLARDVTRVTAQRYALRVEAYRLRRNAKRRAAHKAAKRSTGGKVAISRTLSDDR